MISDVRLKELFPLVYTVLSGAVSANSGGKLLRTEPRWNEEQCRKAEKELSDNLLDVKSCYWLGMCADEELTMSFRGRRLRVYKIVDSMY